MESSETPSRKCTALKNCHGRRQDAGRQSAGRAQAEAKLNQLRTWPARLLPYGRAARSTHVGGRGLSARRRPTLSARSAAPGCLHARVTSLSAQQLQALLQQVEGLSGASGRPAGLSTDKQGQHPCPALAKSPRHTRSVTTVQRHKPEARFYTCAAWPARAKS
jgi:hypothetical protein